MSCPEYLLSNISNWFGNKDILITGSSGFIGQVLVEKILRCCPNVRTIYLLIREKRGLTPEQRIAAFAENPIFDSIREKNPVVFRKLIGIECDMSKPELGISKKNREILLKDVAIVLHSAATVKFEEPLKYAIDTNIFGTQQLIEMCFSMKRLEAFVYISTAYSNCNIFEIEENVYPSEIEINELLKELKKLHEQHDENPEKYDNLKKQIVRKRPNLYSATKSLAENVVHKYSGRLPIAIVRPSIVCGALKEPLVGWVDNFNGATGIIMGIGKGLLKSLIMETSCIADLVPVDLTINMIIAAAWACSQSKNKQLKVYNFTSGSVNPLCWGPFIRLAEKNFKKYALTGTLWYPYCFLQTNTIVHKLLVYKCNIRSHLLDFIAKSLGKQPILVKTQNRLNAAVKAMEYFTTHTFKFRTDNVDKLLTSMSEIDKKIFNFNLRTLDWESYMEDYCKGIRQYVLKDPLDTLPVARAKLEKLKYLHLFVILMLYLFIIWFFYWIICKFI